MPTPEQLAREKIDRLLEAAGWVVQDMNSINLGAGLGVAVREFQTLSGPADYILFVDRQAVGAIEAKPKGTTLRGVSEQTARYQADFPADTLSFSEIGEIEFKNSVCMAFIPFAFP